MEKSGVGSDGGNGNNLFMNDGSFMEKFRLIQKEKKSLLASHNPLQDGDDTTSAPQPAPAPTLAPTPAPAPSAAPDSEPRKRKNRWDVDTSSSSSSSTAPTTPATTQEYSYYNKSVAPVQPKVMLPQKKVPPLVSLEKLFNPSQDFCLLLAGCGSLRLVSAWND